MPHLHTDDRTQRTPYSTPVRPDLSTRCYIHFNSGQEERTADLLVVGRSTG